MRLPVDKRSNADSNAALLFKNDRCALMDAIFVFIESGILFSLFRLLHSLISGFNWRIFSVNAKKLKKGVFVSDWLERRLICGLTEYCGF
jgi:hypothetical protein